MSSEPQESKKPWTIEIVDIPEPCTVPWESMEGTDRKRFCGECDKNVYNISSMSAAEATKLVLDNEGRVCISMLRRADGTIVTDECPAMLRPVRDGVKKGLSIAAAFLALVISGFNAAKADDPASETPKSAPPANHPGRTGGMVAPNWDEEHKPPAKPQPDKNTPGAGQPNGPDMREVGKIKVLPEQMPAAGRSATAGAYSIDVMKLVVTNLSKLHVCCGEPATFELEVLADGKVKSCQLVSKVKNQAGADKVRAEILKMKMPALPKGVTGKGIKISF